MTDKPTIVSKTLPHIGLVWYFLHQELSLFAARDLHAGFTRWQELLAAHRRGTDS